MQSAGSEFYEYYSPKILLSTSDNKITYHQRRTSSDIVIVAFGEIDSGLSEAGFASSLCFELGYDYVYVAQKKFTQYQRLSSSELYSALRPIIGKKIITYGSSLGAYCAVYYSGILSCDVIALSPRIPAHPVIDILMNHRYKNCGFHHGQLVDGFLTSGKVCVFYDPDNIIDSFYIERFIKSAYPLADYFSVNGAGHYTAKALALSGQLKKIVVDFANGREVSYYLDDDKILQWNKSQILKRFEKNKKQHAVEIFLSIASSPCMDGNDLNRYGLWLQEEKKKIKQKKHTAQRGKQAVYSEKSWLNKLAAVIFSRN